jgi:ABC-type methionine transport system permease subunit
MVEALIWLGIAAAVAVLVVLAAPYHNRLIERRPKVGNPHNWD